MYCNWRVKNKIKFSSKFSMLKVLIFLIRKSRDLFFDSKKKKNNFNKKYKIIIDKPASQLSSPSSNPKSSNMVLMVTLFRAISLGTSNFSPSELCNAMVEEAILSERFWWEIWIWWENEVNMLFQRSRLIK